MKRLILALAFFLTAYPAQAMLIATQAAQNFIRNIVVPIEYGSSILFSSIEISDTSVSALLTPDLHPYFDVNEHTMTLVLSRQTIPPLPILFTLVFQDTGQQFLFCKTTDLYIPLKQNIFLPDTPHLIQASNNPKNVNIPTECFPAPYTTQMQPNTMLVSPQQVPCTSSASNNAPACSLAPIWVQQQTSTIAAPNPQAVYRDMTTEHQPFNRHSLTPSAPFRQQYTAEALPPLEKNSSELTQEVAELKLTIHSLEKKIETYIPSPNEITRQPQCSINDNIIKENAFSPIPTNDNLPTDNVLDKSVATANQDCSNLTQNLSDTLLHTQEHSMTTESSSNSRSTSPGIQQSTARTIKRPQERSLPATDSAYPFSVAGSIKTDLNTSLRETTRIKKSSKRKQKSQHKSASKSLQADAHSRVGDCCEDKTIAHASLIIEQYLPTKHIKNHRKTASTAAILAMIMALHVFNFTSMIELSQLYETLIEIACSLSKDITPLPFLLISITFILAENYFFAPKKKNKYAQREANKRSWSLPTKAALYSILLLSAFAQAKDYLTPVSEKLPILSSDTNQAITKQYGEVSLPVFQSVDPMTLQKQKRQVLPSGVYMQTSTVQLKNLSTKQILALENALHFISKQSDKLNALKACGIIPSSTDGQQKCYKQYQKAAKKSPKNQNYYSKLKALANLTTKSTKAHAISAKKVIIEQCDGDIIVTYLPCCSIAEECRIPDNYDDPLERVPPHKKIAFLLHEKMLNLYTFAEEKTFVYNIERFSPKLNTWEVVLSNLVAQAGQAADIGGFPETGIYRMKEQSSGKMRALFCVIKGDFNNHFFPI